MESGYVFEGDHKTIAKAIKDRVSLISRKRAQRQQVCPHSPYCIQCFYVYCLLRSFAEIINTAIWWMLLCCDQIMSIDALFKDFNIWH